jgi:hypothetical protein
MFYLLLGKNNVEDSSSISDWNNEDDAILGEILTRPISIVPCSIVKKAPPKTRVDILTETLATHMQTLCLELQRQHELKGIVAILQQQRSVSGIDAWTESYLMKNYSASLHRNAIYYTLASPLHYSTFSNKDRA